MDRLLRTLVTRAARRGFAGEPLWLGVAAAAWLVRRGRSRGQDVAWRGRVRPGERLVITVTERGASAAVADGE